MRLDPTEDQKSSVQDSKFILVFELKKICASRRMFSKRKNLLWWPRKSRSLW